MNSISIFISSVQDEFATERKQIAEYIRQDALFSQYFVPFLFEESPAQDKSAQVAYLEQAANAEVYLLLIGSKYGYVDAGGVSPTEKEYNTASAHHAYRMTFVKNVDKREPKEESFKRRIDNAVIRNAFSTYDELQSAVYASLIEYMVSHHILRNGPFDSSIHPDATIADLDKEKIRHFVGLAREKRQFPIQYTEENIHQILYSLHLITRGKVAGKVRGKVAGKVKGKAAGIVDKKFARIIMAIRGNTVSAHEIMAVMQLKGGDNFRKRYLYPSIEAGYVSKLYPDSESRPDQAYYLTEKGLQMLNEIEQKKK